MRETRIVEFKETITNTFLKTVSAFSNYDGGDYQATTSTQATSTGRVETTTEAPTTAAPTTAAPTTEAPTTASQSQDNNSSKEQ